MHARRAPRRARTYAVPVKNSYGGVRFPANDLTCDKGADDACSDDRDHRVLHLAELSLSSGEALADHSMNEGVSFSVRTPIIRSTMRWARQARRLRFGSARPRCWRAAFCVKIFLPAGPSQSTAKLSSTLYSLPSRSIRCAIGARKSVRAERKPVAQIITSVSRCSTVSGKSL